MSISKSTTTQDIIDSGTLFTFKREPLLIETKTDLKFQFNFITNLDKGNKIETELGEDGKYLKILIFNAKGIGSTTEPLLVAQDDRDQNKKTLLSFGFSESGDSFLFHYTVFQTKSS